MQPSDHANPPCLPWRHCRSTEPVFEHLLLTVLESNGSVEVTGHLELSELLQREKKAGEHKMQWRSQEAKEKKPEMETCFPIHLV